MAKLMTTTVAENVAAVMLNRPEVFNALNPELTGCFAENLISLATDRSIRAVIISGEGKAFSTGGDIRYMLSFAKGISSGAWSLIGDIGL